MADLKERVVEARAAVKAARARVREIHQIHDRLKSRLSVRLALELRAAATKSGLRATPPTGGIFRQAITAELRGAADDVLALYDANERLFGTGAIEDLLEGISATLLELEREVERNAAPPNSDRVVTMALSIANTVITAYAAIRA